MTRNWLPSDLTWTLTKFSISHALIILREFDFSTDRWHRSKIRRHLCRNSYQIVPRVYNKTEKTRSRYSETKISIQTVDSKTFQKRENQPEAVLKLILMTCQPKVDSDAETLQNFLWSKLSLNEVYTPILWFLSRSIFIERSSSAIDF